MGSHSRRFGDISGCCRGRCKLTDTLGLFMGSNSVMIDFSSATGCSFSVLSGRAIAPKGQRLRDRSCLLFPRKTCAIACAAALQIAVWHINI